MQWNNLASFLNLEPNFLFLELTFYGILTLDSLNGINPEPNNINLNKYNQWRKKKLLPKLENEWCSGRGANANF